MAQLIRPILDTFETLLQAMDASTLGELRPFAEVKSAGVSFNFPYAAIEPGRTVFDLSQDQSRAQAHGVVIQIGVTGTDPEALKNECIAYAQAVDAAIAAWPLNAWPTPAIATPVIVKEVSVVSIEYSTTYTQGGAFSRFVELVCAVSAEEYP